MNRSLSGDDATGLCTTLGLADLLVLLDDVYTLNDDTAGLLVDSEN